MAGDFTVCHVGANYGEEIPKYNNWDHISRIILVEGNSLVISMLNKKAKEGTKKPCIVIPRLISDHIGEEFFHTVIKPENHNYNYYGKPYRNYGASSLETNYPGRGRYKLVKKKLTKVVTLSKAFEEFGIDPYSINWLVIDIQNAELKLLKGFKEVENIEVIDFDSDHLTPAITEFLVDKGFSQTKNRFLNSKKDHKWIKKLN